MKQLITLVVFCLPLLACTSGSTENSKAHSAETKAAALATKPFDLAGLTLKEKNALALLTASKVKPEPVSNADQTLLGYEVIKSSNANVLRFEGESLAGAAAAKRNYVLFHYNAQTKALAFYEVNLYNKIQADALLQQLQKMGKPHFEKVDLDKGAVEIDERGNTVERGKEQRQTYRVWENQQKGLTYFLSERGVGKDFEAKLTVLNRSAAYAKNWISFASLAWYKEN